jgi:hypothetical protein
MKKAKSSKYRWVWLALCLAFFVPLSISLGWQPLWLMGQDTYRARHWVAVPAQVKSSALVAPREAKVAKEVQATYQYTWKEVRYTGQRIGFGVASADGFGSWQRDTYDQLKNAELSGESISVWIDPEQPSDSVIQRQPRIELLVFHGLCALVLTLLAGLSLWLFRSMGSVHK